MDPPSAQLVRRLGSLGLCTARDLRRCRRRVKRLARDLPTFDSVWVDALVQGRRLTPFQAQWLESAAPERLAAGPCLLVDRIGSDGRFTHYRGRVRDGRQTVTVVAVNREPEISAAALERLRAFIQRVRGFSHPGLLLPSGSGTGASGVVVIGPWVEGTSLHDLLVRRGRFPPDVVAGTGWQLAEALSALEKLGCIHGDIRLRNIRLTRRGQSLLVNAGLVPALWPELTIHADVPPDCYDAVAPELIGSGRTADVSTDMYALGCVLWELLAGRPAFPHGDPLTKLAAHQTLAVPDVRTWAPDTPAELASVMAALTARDPGRRPASFNEVCLRLRSGRRGSRRKLRAFHASFRRPVGAPDRGHRVLIRRTAATAGLLLALSLVSVGLLDAGARSELLSIATSGPGELRERVSRLASPAAPESRDGGDTSPEPPSLLPFPTQVDRGVLILAQPGPYAAAEVAAAGPLRIRGAPGVRPSVLISDKPMRIWAEQVVLENIEFRRQAPGADAVPLAVVDAQALGVKQCRFESGESRSTALVWSPLDESSSAPQRVLVSETLFLGGGTAIEARGTPGAVGFENVLKHGPGALLEFGAVDTAPRMTAVLRHVTLRNSGGVIRPAARPGAATQVELTLEDCVVDIPAPGAIVEFSGGAPPGWQRRLRITGENTLVLPGTRIAAHISTGGGPARELPVDEVSIDGLLSSEIVFAGDSSRDPRDSAVTERLGHGRSIQPPGINPDVFAPGTAEPYNSEARAFSEPTHVRTP